MSNVLFRLFFFYFLIFFFLHYSMARVCMVFCCCLRFHLCYSMAVLPLSRLLHSLPPFVCNAFSISSKYYTFYAVHAVCIHSLVFVILSAQTNFVQNRFFFSCIFTVCTSCLLATILSIGRNVKRALRTEKNRRTHEKRRQNKIFGAIKNCVPKILYKGKKKNKKNSSYRSCVSCCALGFHNETAWII